jgi:hypothetical protein
MKQHPQPMELDLNEALEVELEHLDFPVEEGEVVSAETSIIDLTKASSNDQRSENSVQGNPQQLDGSNQYSNSDLQLIQHEATDNTKNQGFFLLDDLLQDIDQPGNMIGNPDPPQINHNL